MERIGHRGASEHNPENTVRAVSEASRRLPAVEVDVRRCGSGEIVVFHDERVDDGTDGSGRVADLPYEQLRTLGVDGSDEGIPLLDDVLEAVPTDVTLHVELKETGLADDVRRLLAARERSNVRISSFSAPALATIARSDWDPEAGLLFGVGAAVEGATAADADDVAANLDLAAVLDCENVHPHVRLCLDTDVVERAHAADHGVFAWGLHDSATDEDELAETIAALADRGVDGVTTDTWDLPHSGRDDEGA